MTGYSPTRHDPDPIGTRCVRALLDRHGVAPSRHVTTVGEILSIRYALSYRRMKGLVAWRLEEIEALAVHFGESLATLFASHAPAQEVPATLSLGEVRFPCRFVPGRRLAYPRRGALVAVALDRDWFVVPANDAAWAPCLEVASLRILPLGEHRWRLAVLIEVGDGATRLIENLESEGCDVQAFAGAQELVAALQCRQFDGFVLAWPIEHVADGDLVRLIRASDARVPVAVWRSATSSADLQEAAVMQAIEGYGILFFDRSSPRLLSAQFLRALAGR